MVVTCQVKTRWLKTTHIYWTKVIHNSYKYLKKSVCLFSNKLQDNAKVQQTVRDTTSKTKTSLQQHAAQIKEALCRMIDLSVEATFANIDDISRKDIEYLESNNETLSKDVEKLNALIVEGMFLWSWYCKYVPMKYVNLYCMIYQICETHFKSLAAFAASFLGVSDHFEILCIKGIKLGRLVSVFLVLFKCLFFYNVETFVTLFYSLLLCNILSAESKPR